MDNITFIKMAGIDGIEVEHVIIDKGNNEFTSMTKAVWDELEANKKNGTLS